VFNFSCVFSIGFDLSINHISFCFAANPNLPLRGLVSNKFSSHLFPLLLVCVALWTFFLPFICLHLHHTSPESSLPFSNKTFRFYKSIIPFPPITIVTKQDIYIFISHNPPLPFYDIFGQAPSSNVGWSGIFSLLTPILRSRETLPSLYPCQRSSFFVTTKYHSSFSSFNQPGFSLLPPKIAIPPYPQNNAEGLKAQTLSRISLAPPREWCRPPPFHFPD